MLPIVKFQTVLFGLFSELTFNLIKCLGHEIAGFDSNVHV